MIDRPAREKMIRSVERYLAEEIDNQIFSAEIDLLKTKDPDVAVVGEKLWTTYCDIKTHTVYKYEEYWDFYRRWMVFLRTDYPLGKVNLIPSWNYPWAVRGAGAAVALLPLILLWGHWIPYFVSCFFIALVCALAFAYKRRRDQRLRWRYEFKWSPRKEWEPFLSEADWLAHQSLADGMAIPPTPPPGKEEPEELETMWHWSTKCALVCSPIAPIWVPILALRTSKWQRGYTLELRTSEPEVLVRSSDSEGSIANS
jgi:hypothetical protein